MKWEYKSVKFKSAGAVFARGEVDNEEFQRMLNYYGWEGRELVNVFDTQGGHGATQLIVAIFKRPVQPKDEDQ